MPLQIGIRGSRTVQDHTEYTIRVQEDGRQWDVHKRFREFVFLDAALRDRSGAAAQLELAELPPRDFLRHQLNLGGFNEQRLQGLQAYLDRIVGQIQSLSEVPLLQDFLGGSNAPRLDCECELDYDEILEALLEGPPQGVEAAAAGSSPVSSAPSVVTMVRTDEPSDLCPASPATGKAKLLAYEVFMGHLPQGNSGVFALVFALRPSDVALGIAVLKIGLQTMLSARPLLAGRIIGGEVSLCNAGVPFTEVHVQGPCPTQIPHKGMFAYCDAREPKEIMCGRDAPLTVKAVVYEDGVVVGVSVSHALMDGSSLFNFVREWGAACQGADPTPDFGCRDALRQRLQSTENPNGLIPRAVRVVQEHLPGPLPDAIDLADRVITKTGSKVAFITCAKLVPSILGLVKPHARLRLPISNARLRVLKDLATPPPGTPGDGWVTTQEALVAHLLVSLWRTFFPPEKEGVACVSFMVDIRRHLGLPDTLSFGTGFQICEVYVDDMGRRSLPDCAYALHEASRGFAAAAASRWHLWHRAFEYRIETEAFVRDLWGRRHADMSLTINNNSKREPLDFGPSCGGVACSLMSNMGPTLLLATPEGMEVLLQSKLLLGATDEQLHDFLKRFNG